jgi:hypothetical protein
MAWRNKAAAADAKVEAAAAKIEAAAGRAAALLATDHAKRAADLTADNITQTARVEFLVNGNIHGLKKQVVDLTAEVVELKKQLAERPPRKPRLHRPDKGA